MARLTIEECWWTDPRRELLIERIGGTDQADIAALRAWRLSQEFWKRGRGLVPRLLFDALKHAQDLVEIGLAEIRGETVYVRGSADYHDWAADMHKGAALGGKKSAKRPRDARGRLQKSSKADPSLIQGRPKAIQVSGSGFDSVSGSDSGSGSLAEPSKNSSNELVLESEGEAGKGGVRPDGASATALAWRAYRDAYKNKYGEAPPWNAKTAGQLKSFVSRIPSIAAPDVAAFYLTHPGARYTAAMHPVGLLLLDAEKIHTEWKTGRTVTGAQARQGEKAAGYKSQLERIAAGEL